MSKTLKDSEDNSLHSQTDFFFDSLLEEMNGKAFAKLFKKDMHLIKPNLSVFCYNGANTLSERQFGIVDDLNFDCQY